MSEKEKEMREMVETLRKLPDHAQEKIGYMIEGAALVSGAHEDEPILYNPMADSRERPALLCRRRVRMRSGGADPVTSDGPFRG